MIQKLKSRKSRIKPGLFAFLLAERIILERKHKNPAWPLGLGWIFKNAGIGPERGAGAQWAPFSADRGGSRDLSV